MILIMLCGLTQMLFCNHSIKIEDWIDKSDNKDYIIARDAGYSEIKNNEHIKMNKLPLLNSGVIIMKNTENNKNLLNHILYDPIHQDNYKKSEVLILLLKYVVGTRRRFAMFTEKMCLT